MTYHRKPLSALLVIITALTMLLGLVGAAPTAQAAVASGPDPRAMRADATHNRAVHDGNLTFYVDAQNATATRADPEDAALGWAPPATGEARGPVHSVPNCIQPPAQHTPAAAVRDHATLSDAELRLYGLPTRAMIPDPVEWATTVRTATTRACFWSDPYLNGKPVIRSSKPTANSPATPVQGTALRATAASISPNTIIPPGGGTPYYTNITGYCSNCHTAWAGWAALNTHNSGPMYYRSGEGYFKIPALGPPGHIDDIAGFWIGIGGEVNPGACGSGQPSLIQAGGDVKTVEGAVERNLWFVNFGDNSFIGCNEHDLVSTCAYPVQCDSAYTLVSNVGDLVEIVIGCGNTQGNCFFIKNTANGEYFSQQFGPNTTYRDGECVAERNVTGLNHPLADFGAVAFDLCRLSVSTTPTGTTTEYGIGGIPGQTLDGYFYAGDTEVDTNPYCMAPSYPTNDSGYVGTDFIVYDNAPSYSDC